MLASPTRTSSLLSPARHTSDHRGPAVRPATRPAPAVVPAARLAPAVRPAPARPSVTGPAPAVIGTLPAGLDGRFVRCSPSPLGESVVHELRLRGGRALWQRNRPVRTDAVSRLLSERPAPGRTFSLTENHAVVYSPGPGVPSLIVRPRAGGAARRFEVAPGAVFHVVNAHEEGHDRIVTDVVRHDGDARPALWRWTANLRTGTLTEQRLTDHVLEFPRIDDRFAGTAHRYTFAVEMDRTALTGPALLRHDLTTGRTQVHRFGHGREAGEPVFVPRHAGAAEGDGWLLTLVQDVTRGRSEVVVLDTADFTGEPVAVVRLPAPVAPAFHSTWIPA